MSRLEEIESYCKKCISGEIVSGKKHILACERFLRDVKNIGTAGFPYYWDEKAADDIVAWFAMLRHSKGILAGKPIDLTDWQKFRECQIYGWKHKDTGFRRFKKSFTEVGRKNAKSQMEAGEALYEISVMATKNHESYEVYTAGTKRDQSKIVFDECALMCRNTLLGTKFRFKRDRIEHVKTGSFIKPLSRQDGKTGDGPNGAMYILDEYHQHPTTEFYDLTLGSNTKEPLLSIITTAGIDLTYPCYTQEYDYCSKILDPGIDVTNDEYFVDICEADEGDDPGDPDTWKKANPIRASYAEGIGKIKSDYELANQIPEKMTAFKTKILNIWVMQRNDSYMDMAKWKACEADEYPIELTGQPCYVGFDLSAKIDLTSVAFIIPFQSDETDSAGKRIIKYILFSHSFIPDIDRVREHVARDKVPYDAWVQMGYLTVTDTPIVDQSAVVSYVMKTAADLGLKIQCFCFDPANAGKVMLDLSEEGYDVEEVFQSHKSLNEATQGFREQVYCGNVIYKRNPLLNYAMSNAVTRTNNGLIKIDKDAATRRIDPVDATLCAFKLALYHDFNEIDYSDYVNTFLEDLGG